MVLKLALKLHETWPWHVLDMTLFIQSVHLLPVSCVHFLSPGEAWRALVTSVFSPACLQPVHIICVLCLSSANVTFMRLSGLVAEAEQTVWCWREQSEGLAQISPNTQGCFIINISEKKQSIDALQVCLLRTPDPEEDEDSLQKTPGTIRPLYHTVRKSLSPSGR